MPREEFVERFDTWLTKELGLEKPVTEEQKEDEMPLLETQRTQDSPNPEDAQVVQKTEDAKEETETQAAQDQQ